MGGNNSHAQGCGARWCATANSQPSSASQPASERARAGPLSFFPHPLLQSLRASGADVITVPRGGQTTYHGPGQLLAYPLLNLRRARLGARALVEALEDAMIATAGAFGIPVCVCVCMTACGYLVDWMHIVPVHTTPPAAEVTWPGRCTHWRQSVFCTNTEQKK